MWEPPTQLRGRGLADERVEGRPRDCAPFRARALLVGRQARRPRVGLGARRGLVRGRQREPADEVAPRHQEVDREEAPPRARTRSHTVARKPHGLRFCPLNIGANRGRTIVVNPDPKYIHV